jgi:hypothetical protein
MGITYIVCGIPDYVECQGEMNEVWYYGEANQVYAVSFRAESHAPDEEAFYTMLPFSTSDYFWQLCVDRWRRK